MNKGCDEDMSRLNSELGGFGRFQRYIFYLSCLTVIMNGSFVVSHVFTMFEPQHRCLVPQCEGPSGSEYEREFLNFTTPTVEGPRNVSDSCTTFAYVGNSRGLNDSCESDSFDDQNHTECSQWVYDSSIFTNTIVTEFNLWCTRSWMAALGASGHMFGMPFGAVVIGDLADRIGRKKGLMVAITIATISEFIASFSLNLPMYFAMRFLSGGSSIAGFQIIYILALEVVPPSKRAFCGMMIKVPFAFGEALVSGVAFAFRDWRHLQLALSIPPFLLWSYFWLMPESIRWLLSKGRHEEAKKVIEKACKMNNVSISSDLYARLFSKIGEEKKEVCEATERQRSVFDLFRLPRLRSMTIVLILSWIIITHGYYGLSTNSANFGGTVFVSYLAVMLVEIPSYVFAYFTLNIWGRKGTIMLLMVVGGVTCLASSLVGEENNLVLIIMSLVGKFCVSAAFPAIYIYAIEIFATQYRSLGLGACSMSARIGGILAPFTARLGKFYKSLPLIVFGVLFLICALILLILPETLDQELPQTLQDSEDCGKEQGIFYFSCFAKNKTRKSKEATELGQETKL